MVSRVDPDIIRLRDLLLLLLLLSLDLLLIVVPVLVHLLVVDVKIFSFVFEFVAMHGFVFSLSSLLTFVAKVVDVDVDEEEREGKCRIGLVVVSVVAPSTEGGSDGIGDDKLASVVDVEESSTNCGGSTNCCDEYFIRFNRWW